jgi:tetratricopeptide (TPR) repeat protein
MPCSFFLAFVLLVTIPAFCATPPAFEQIAKQAAQAQAQEKLNQAIDLYRQGLSKNSTWNEGWWNLGSLLYDQDRFPEAEVAFRRFVASSPNPGPGYAFLGLCEYETREYDRALQHFRAWSSRGWSGNTRLIDVSVFHFALLLTREGKFVEALFLLAAEVQKSYSSPALIEGMGLASLRIKNTPEGYPSAQREAVWLAGEAAYYMAFHQPKFERSDEYARRLRAHYDTTPNVHYFLGTLLKFEDDNDGAAREFRRELELSPQHAAAMLELAQLNLVENQLDPALQFAKKASDLEPHNSEAHRTLGEIESRFRKYEDSVREFEKAKQLAPDSAPVRFQLAAAYRKMGRTQDAARETAVFNLLKDKQLVIESPQEKLRAHPEALK